MNRDRAMRLAQAAARLADDERADPVERQASQRRVDELSKKFKLSDSDVRPRRQEVPSGIDFAMVGRWGGEEMSMISSVIGVAGGQLRGPDPSGNAWVAGPRIALPRLRALTMRLIDIYRREGERIDRDARAWQSPTILSMAGQAVVIGFDFGFIGGPPPDKIGFWVGLTVGFVERLTPKPPPDRRCTALVHVAPPQRREPSPRQTPTEPNGEPPDAPAAAQEVPDGGRVYEVSRADLEAGRRAAMCMVIDPAAGELTAGPGQLPPGVFQMVRRPTPQRRQR